MLFRPQPSPSGELVNWPALQIVNQRDGTQQVLPCELIYLSGEHNYSWLHCSDGRRLLVPYTLKRMQIQLPEVSFIRLHRSYVVNRMYVDRVETHPTSNHRLYLMNGASLPVARRNWVHIRKQLWLVKQTAAGLLADPYAQGI